LKIKYNLHLMKTKIM